MASIASLNAALSGLRVSQQQIDVISGNVANVGTPGYSRKILPQSSQSLQGVTVGVLGETIIRNVDLNLQRDMWTQVSDVGRLSVQQTYLERVEQFHGPPDQELSVAAEISRLHDAFSALANSPEDSFLLLAAVDQAVDTADKINDLSDLITSLRNDAQEEMRNTVDQVNDLLQQIAELNDNIQDNLNIGKTTAQLEDERDMAINELSGLMEVSYFIRGDGVMVVQTNRGVELASNRAEQLYFDPSPLSATTFYPDSAASIYVGNPLLPQSVDITTLSPGGKLGGLIELRDVTFPKQMAQLDELAHKMALRFQDQGLLLFTDASGNVPPDTAPDPTTLPNPTPVAYVGFSREIRVNAAVLSDNTLLQKGTVNTDVPVQAGSNEVIRRVLEFTFGDVEFQEAIGTIDMRSFATGGVDLQNWLGVFSENTITGGRGISSFPTIADLVASADNDLDAPDDEFQITFEEARTGTGPFTITVNMTTADTFVGANALDQLIQHINNEIALAGMPASLAASASIGANGEIILESAGTITIDGSFGPTGMTQQGLDFLGLSEGTYAPTDPYFDVQIGNDDPVRIFIEPGDTEVELIDKLILDPTILGDTGVPGLAYDDVTFAATGELILRPGDDYTNPAFGGDIKLISGPFQIDPAVAGSPDLAVLGAGNGVNMISALFGSFNAGPPPQNLSPITSFGYTSETNGSLVPPIPTTPFRSSLLGPNADISTNIIGATRLMDFAQKMVNEHTQELNLVKSRMEDEDTLRQLLQTQLTNESGVNLDEELGFLIVVQTAYAASARVITAVDQMFEELLAAV